MSAGYVQVLNTTESTCVMRNRGQSHSARFPQSSSFPLYPTERNDYFSFTWPYQYSKYYDNHISSHPQFPPPRLRASYIDAVMSGNTHHHILYRTIPLICQALVTCPDDETVWIEGLRLLSSAKLRRALPHTSSIWLPLLLKGLEVNKSEGIILESLRLLIEAANILEPMKSRLVKPLRSLGKIANLAGTKELTLVAERLGLKVWDNNNTVIGSDAPNQVCLQTIKALRRNWHMN